MKIIIDFREKISAELKQLQKEYKKSIKPKVEKVEKGKNFTEHKLK